MKKAIIAIATLAATFGISQAQILRIKKGEIRLDKNLIGYLAEEKKEDKSVVYRVLGTDSQEVFFFIPRKDHSKGMYWQTIGMPGYEKTGDVEYYPFTLTFNVEKGVTEQAVVVQKFYDNGAWQKPTIKAFIDDNTMSYPERHAILKKEEAEAQKMARSVGLSVGTDGNITAWGKVIGKVTSRPFGDIYFFDLYNASGQLKFKGESERTGARYYSFANSKNEVAGRFEASSFDMKTPVGVNSYLNHVVAMQLYRGEWTENDAVTAAQKQSQHFATINIDKQEGVLTKAEGEEISGTISIAFAKPANNSGIASLDFVDKVSIWTKNEKGKDKLLSFKPKEVKGFKAGNRTFETVNVKYLLFSAKEFCELLYENPRAKVFAKYLEDGDYFLVFKANDVEHGVILSSVINKEKLATQIFEQCPALKSFVTDNKLSNTKDDAIRIADAYCQ